MTGGPGLTSRVTSAGLGAALGATAWVSMGAVAVVDPDRMVRVGALPSWPWLAGLVAVGATLAALRPTRRRTSAPLALLVLIWLPWLPVHVPDAFLLWDGPLEGLVWAATLGGVAWTWARSAVVVLDSAPWSSPSRAPWIAAILAAVVFTVSWFAARPRVPAGDEPHYLVITQSVLRDGDLRIENNHRDEHYLEYYGAALRPDFMRRGTDRQIYSIHAPGISALVLPGFAVAGYTGAVATVIAVAAFGVALMWRAAHLLTRSSGAAWMATTAVMTSAPVVLHGFTIYPDPVGATMAMVAVVALVSLDRGHTLTRAGWVATGAALASLPWLHTRFAIVAGVLGAALVVRVIRRPDGVRAAQHLLAVPAVSAAAWFSYFWMIYGTPNPAAPYGSRPEGALSFVAAGLTGLLVDQQFGLAANAPILFVGFVACLTLMGRRPRLASELLVAMTLYLSTAASYPMWWGGYSAPARFALVVLPFLVVPLADLWARGSTAVRAVIGVLMALSAATTAALVGVDRGALIYNGRDGYDLLLDWLSRSADLTLATPSVHRDGAATAALDALVWLVAGVLVASVATLASRAVPGRVSRVAAWLATPAAMMLAVTVVWAGRDRNVVTPSTSQMSFLERWHRAPTSVAVQLTPTRGLAVDDVPRRLNLATSTRGPRQPPGDPLLLIPEVPAGEFDVFVEGTAHLAGTAVVRLGRQDVPLDTWRLDDRPAGYTGLILRLPVDAHSITVTGDDAARRSVRRMTLRPRTLAAPATSHVALRAARFGQVAVFALDDNAYLEPGALWVRGERAAMFVVAADRGVHPVLSIKAGEVANDVVLSAGTWIQRVPLAADDATDVTLPDAALAPAALTITSTTGFRPSRSGNGDGRWLGVYLTWPERSTPGGSAVR